MGLIYLGIGILAVFGLHLCFSWLISTKPQHVRRVLQWIAVLGIIAIIILLVRFGATTIAAFVGGFLAITALLNRLAIWIPIVYWLRKRNQQRTQQSSPTKSSGNMSVDEACQILGVKPHASPKEIKDAHRRLMQKIHPDQGGSEYLASQINQAKDTLLKRK